MAAIDKYMDRQAKVLTDLQASKERKKGFFNKLSYPLELTLALAVCWMINIDYLWTWLHVKLFELIALRRRLPGATMTDMEVWFLQQLGGLIILYLITLLNAIFVGVFLWLVLMWLLVYMICVLLKGVGRTLDLVCRLVRYLGQQIVSLALWVAIAFCALILLVYASYQFLPHSIGLLLVWIDDICQDPWNILGPLAIFTDIRNFVQAFTLSYRRTGSVLLALGGLLVGIFNVFRRP